MSHHVVIGAQGAEIDTEVQTKGAMSHARHWRQLHCEHHNAGALRGAMHPLLGPRDFGFVEDLAAARSRHPRGFGGAVTERKREREGETEGMGKGTGTVTVRTKSTKSIACDILRSGTF